MKNVTITSWRAAVGGALIGLAAFGASASPLLAQTPEPPAPAPAPAQPPTTPEQMNQMMEMCTNMMRMMSGMMNHDAPGTMPGGGSPESPGMMPGMMGR